MRRIGDYLPTAPDKFTKDAISPLMLTVKRCKSAFDGEIRSKSLSILRKWREILTGKKREKDMKTVVEQFKESREQQELEEEQRKKRTATCAAEKLPSKRPRKR